MHHPLHERFRIAGLQQHAAGPGEVEYPALTAFRRRDAAAFDRAAQLELGAEVVGDDVAGVDRDDLLGLQVDDVHGAVDADQRLAVTGRPQAEATLTAEQVGHAAPLRVDLDTGGVGDPATAAQEKRPLRGDGDGYRVAGQQAGDVDPTAVLRCGVGGDEERPAAEKAAGQAFQDAALRLGFELDAGTVRDHGAALHPQRLTWREIAAGDGER